jgi:molybdate transport system permease protein
VDWSALVLSFELGAATTLVLAPLGVWLGRLLAFREFPAKGFVEALVALPLLLPPTQNGF